MKVLLATEKPFAPKAVQGITKIVESAGHELLKLEKYADKSELLEAVKDANAIIIRSDIIDAEVIEAAPNLKIVVRAGSGYDNVDLETATKHNVCVMNTPGQNANAVAELVVGMMLYMYRNQFDGTAGKELIEKRIGLHAWGNVAKNVARVAEGLNMDIYAFSRTLAKDKENKVGEYGVKTAYTTEELYEDSDIISLHVPLNEHTRESINYNLLSKMSESGLLVNTARKEIIAEDDLIRIMEERPAFKFATDIKPDKHEEFLEKFPKRYFATPKKMGAQTAEANINAGMAAAQQIISFFKDGDETFKVNK